MNPNKQINASALVRQNAAHHHGAQNRGLIMFVDPSVIGAALNDAVELFKIDLAFIQQQR